ncbi:MAG: SRPBCC family protein [Saprospiraceae bacterium]|nr:SRPBCC family protein [Saprospiraceae bacterium]
MDLQEQIAIKASRNRVFTYLNQVEKRSEYIPMLDEVILLDPPPIRLGSRYIEVATIAGRDLKTTYQVIEWEQDQRVKVKTIKSIFPIAAAMELIEQGGYTIVKLQLSFTLKGIYRLGAPIVRGIVQQQAVDILRKLKKNIEGESIK